MQPVPRSIGKYAIVRELGRGATSRVYLGRDAFADREVAIKVFDFGPDMAEDARGLSMRRKAYLAEAGLVGRLNHPHIAQIYDAGSDGDHAYVVMEYVRGGTLDAHADPQSLLPLPRVIEIIFKCARALELAMREGIIHRDIKPGNILVTESGDIKISDFGASILAKPADATTRTLTGTGETVIGSPAYMSPEQIRNDKLTHQSDIYSLGVVMYRLITGRLPFTASNHIGLAYAILNTEPARPSDLRPNLPAALDAIVLRALAKTREGRYQNWAEFGRDLTQAFAVLRADDSPVSDSEQFQALRALPFFGGFSDVALWEVVRISTWHRPRRGDVIIREGDIGDALYVLVDGEIDVSIRGQRVSSVKPGGCFGEMLYFQDQSTRRGTTMTAQVDCAAIELKAQAMRSATDAVQAEFNKACMRVLLERVGNINVRLAMLKAAGD
ncbi:MAG: protein kinase [Burkholderiales bacterium]|nr:protein kinase [Burkholderiales bacterium]